MKASEREKISLANPIHLLALGFGSGLAKQAPGTFGTLAAVPFFLLLANLPLSIYIAICVFTAIIGFYLCGKTADDLGVHDHPAIVWDEFVGFFITMIAAPAGWEWVILGFVVFRFFDIVKPWPIKYFDKHVHGGVGIMLDDILAGVCSFVVLQLVVYLV